MKDIDFDELDRAVGSVLGNSSSSNNVSSDTKPATSETPVTTPVAVTPAEPAAPATSTFDAPADAVEPTSSVDDTDDADTVETNAATEATPVVTPAVQPATSPAKKRGQFLDMVHPSANMRHTGTLPNGPRKALTPLGAPQPPHLTVDASADVTPAAATVRSPTLSAQHQHEFQHTAPSIQGSSQDTDESETDVTTEDGATPTTRTHSAIVWPDPIDVASPTHDDDASEPVKNEQTESSDVKGETEPESMAIAPEQIPFVQGVEVEKRPLGSLATATTTSNDESPVIGARVQPKAAINEPDLSGPEFSQEINSVESNSVADSDDSEGGNDTVDKTSDEIENTEVESDETSETSQTSQTNGVSEKDETPIDDTSAVSDTEIVTEAKPINEPAVTSIAKPEIKESAIAANAAAPIIAPSVAQSIPQQYKTVASPAHDDDDEDDEQHPLFDSHEYHQPLIPAHVNKKSKKGLLVVLLLFVLVCVGAALGYLAFRSGL